MIKMAGLSTRPHLRFPHNRVLPEPTGERPVSAFLLRAYAREGWLLEQAGDIFYGAARSNVQVEPCRDLRA